MTLPVLIGPNRCELIYNHDKQPLLELSLRVCFPVRELLSMLSQLAPPANMTQRPAATGPPSGAARKDQGVPQPGKPLAKQLICLKAAAPLTGNPRITHGNRAYSQPGSPTQLPPGSGKGNGHLATPSWKSRRSSYGRCLTKPCRDIARHPPLSPSRLSRSKDGLIEKCGLHRPPRKTRGSLVPRQWTSRWQRWRDGKRQCAGRRRSLLMNTIPRGGLARIQKSVQFSKVRSSDSQERLNGSAPLFVLFGFLGDNVCQALTTNLNQRKKG